MATACDSQKQPISLSRPVRISMRLPPKTTVQNSTRFLGASFCRWASQTAVAAIMKKTSCATNDGWSAQSVVGSLIVTGGHRPSSLSTIGARFYLRA